MAFLQTKIYALHYAKKNSKQVINQIKFTWIKSKFE